MHRHILVAFVCAIVIVGCGPRTPVSPDVGGPSVTAIAQTQPLYDERYRLWGEWEWFIPETHDRVDLIPRRTVRGHLNVLKWVEDACYDCVKILGVHNNGDSTIDVMVRVKHPMPGEPQYTGYDVKGIIMFNGSYVFEQTAEKAPPWGEPLIISWKERGDAELLNADGYTLRWSPSYDSGSPLPILNYWRGKYAIGQDPTATLNAYLDFYTTEERHMFLVSGQVTRTYHIYLPPGPLTAGYALEACWVPPDVMPVTDPLNDFPVSANQEEPYYFRIVVNNGEPVDKWICCGWNNDCSELYAEVHQWGGVTVNHAVIGMPEPFLSCTATPLEECSDDPDNPVRRQMTPYGFGFEYPPGVYRGYAIAMRGYGSLGEFDQFAYTYIDWIRQ